MKILFFALPWLLLPFAFAGEEGFKSTPLAEPLFLLEGSGANITASIGPDGVFLVDSDFAPMAPKLLEKLKELGGASPRYLVNTHFHYDHTGGNEVFGASATIIAASAVRDRLQTEQTLWKEKHPPLPKQAWPVLTFENSLTLHLNGEDIKILHLPKGHTDGDTVVFFPKRKVASLGDLYFAGMYPIFHPEHEGSLEGYIKNLELILAQIPSDTKIVPGHGNLSNRTELSDYTKMIKASLRTVRAGIKSGRSLEEIQKAGLPSNWDSYSGGYLTTDRWLALVYQALKK